jgi:hypothetical protein
MSASLKEHFVRRAFLRNSRLFCLKRSAHQVKRSSSETLIKRSVPLSMRPARTPQLATRNPLLATRDMIIDETLFTMICFPFTLKKGE